MNSIVREDLQNERQIIIERLIHAPREIVWKCFMEPGNIEQWWGPEGFTTTTHKRDFTPGGTWLFTMHGPDGTDYENRIEFIDIIEPELISHSHGGDGETAWIRFEVIMTFEEKDGGTLVTLHSEFPTAEMRDAVARDFGAIEGGQQNLARFAAMAEKMARGRG